MKKEHSAADWSTRPLPRAVAGVRRPRRRGAASSCARRWSTELEEAGKDRVGAPGVRGPARLPARPSASRGVAPYVRRCTGSAAAAPWAPSGRCGRPATRSPQERDVTPGPDHPGLRDRRRGARRCPTTATALLADQGLPRPRRRALRPHAGSPPSPRSGDLPEDDLPGRPPAQRRSAAAARLGRARPGRRPPAGARAGGDDRAGRASTSCRSRTCSPPTTCAGCSGRRRPPASDGALAEAVAAQLRGLGARAWQIELTAARPSWRRSTRADASSPRPAPDVVPPEQPDEPTD